MIARFDFEPDYEQHHRGLEPVSPYLRYPDLEKQRDAWRLRAIFGWIVAALGWSLFIVALIFSMSGPVFAAAEFRVGRIDVLDAQAAVNYVSQHPTPWSLRVFWLQETSNKLVGGMRFVPNATINRTSRGVALTAVEDGHLVIADLLLLSRNFTEFIELAGLCERFADLDFYFHERNQLVDALVVQPGCQLFVKGKSDCTVPAGFVVTSEPNKDGWHPFTFAGREGWVHKGKLKLVKIAPFAAHIAPQMLQLQLLTGSRAAFLRADDWVRLAFSQVDEGQYYNLLGITGLSFEQVADRYGADVTQLNKRNSLNWGAVFSSVVTGVERAYVVAPSIGAQADNSRGIFGATFDFRFDNRKDDPLATLFFFLLTNKFDAGEAIFMLPNGFPVGILYDGQGNLQDAAPQEVATDPTDRTPNHILQAGISCNRCHDLWWKDAGNNVRWTLNNGKVVGGIYGIADAAFNGLTLEQVYGKLSESYRANVNTSLDESRRALATQVAGACGVSAREAIDGASELYASASYGDHKIRDDLWTVSPQLVLQRHGIEIIGEPTPLELRIAFDRLFPWTEGVVEFPEVAAWRTWDTLADQPDAPQPNMEKLRRSFTYLAAIRDYSILSPKPPTVE